MKTTWKRIATTISLGAVTAACLSGCSLAPDDSGPDSSRAGLYESVEQLSDDSALIAVGQVASRESVRDIDDLTEFSLSTVRVGEVVKSEAGIAPGSDIIVRQVGGEEQDPGVGLLEVGATYLLYLTPSGLDGERASHFYVTGADAGIYSSADDTTSRSSAERFEQVAVEPGETLPATITLDEADRAVGGS